MKLPYPMKDKTEVTIKITNGTDDSGAPLVIASETTKCTFIEKASMKPDNEGKFVQVVGMLFKKGDILPTCDILEGYVGIGSSQYIIRLGSRIRDPLGNVHHIEMELMR